MGPLFTRFQAAAKVRDDRSAPITPIPEKRLLELAAEATQTGKADIAAAFTQAYGVTMPKQNFHQPLTAGTMRRLGVLLAVVVVAILAAVLLSTVFGWTSTPSVVLPVVLGVMTFGSGWALGAHDNEMIDAYKAALASRDLCRACGYDMQRLPPEADGCARCPECGAAWRLTMQAPALEQAEFVRQHHPAPPSEPGGSFARPITLAGGVAVDALGVAQPCVSLAHLNDPAITEAARLATWKSRCKYAAFLLFGVAIDVFLFWKFMPSALQPSLSFTWLFAVAMVATALMGAYTLVHMFSMLRVDSGGHASIIAKVAIDHGRCPACASPLAELDRTTLRRPCSRCSAVWNVLREPGAVS
ncbi:MAG: hypothetical protein ACK5ZG_10940 [Phycisphaerae bacterium]|jgi:hypothetical protein